MKKNSYIECGKIINTHGCHGGVKLESWCNTPEVLASLKSLYLLSGGNYTGHRVLRASVFRQFVVAELEGIADMDAALALKNTIVYARRSDIPLDEGEYFIADLIGLPVRDASTGKLYGTRKEMINRGASDIYVVDTPDGDRMIPAVPEFIRSIDPDTEILVSPIEGMLD